MVDNLIEVYESAGRRPTPVYVSISENWRDAIDKAARLDCAEILVYGRNENEGLVVYSDLMGVHSGLWWREEIANRRRELGR